MLNSCNFIGNLGNEPEIRSLNDGKEVANLSLAVTKRWRDKEGNQQEKTEWVRATVFSEGLVKLCKNYLKKGSKVHLNGEMQTRKWTDKDGNDKYTTEIVLSGFTGSITMLDSKGDNEQKPAAQGGFTGKTDNDIDSELPF
jgi:single-strand DNA-binding protein